MSSQPATRSDLERVSAAFDAALKLAIDAERQAAGTYGDWHRAPTTLMTRVWNDDAGRKIVRDAMGLVEDYVPRSFATSVRGLATVDGIRGLAFVDWVGEAWTDGSDLGASDQVKRFTPLSDDETTLAQTVLRTKKTVSVEDVRNPPAGLRPCPSFTDMAGLCVIPIYIAGAIEGVLDLRSRTEKFDANDIQIGSLVASQIGLLLESVGLIKDVHSLVDSQIRMVQDLEHQLATPLNATANLLGLLCMGEDRSSDLWTCKMLAEHTARIANAADLFGRLVQDEPIIRSPQPFSGRDLRRKVDAAIRIAKVLVPNRRKVLFRVDKKGFERLGGKVWCDETHLEQSLGQILDNAGKYSHSDTTVHVSARKSSNGAVIEVASDGAPIRKADLEHVTERMWRSPDARFYAAKGRGIGLWITDRLLSENGGKLQIRADGDRTTVMIDLSAQRAG